MDNLINDKSWPVREAVAKQGYGLDILINDEDWEVRREVAKQGYGLDILINDEDWEVREAVKNYLISHNLTLKQFLKNQINILVKKSKSLQEALENYTSLKKENDEKKL